MVTWHQCSLLTTKNRENQCFSQNVKLFLQQKLQVLSLNDVGIYRTGKGANEGY